MIRALRHQLAKAINLTERKNGTQTYAMKKTRLIIITGVTAVAAVTSLSLTVFPHPTNLQQFFFIASSAIAVIGGMVIFLLIEKDQDDPRTP